MGWIELFTPPEWPTWGWLERIVYVGALSLFLFLIGLGGKALHAML